MCKAKENGEIYSFSSCPYAGRALQCNIMRPIMSVWIYTLISLPLVLSLLPFCLVLGYVFVSSELRWDLVRSGTKLNPWKEGGNVVEFGGYDTATDWGLSVTMTTSISELESSTIKLLHSTFIYSSLDKRLNFLGNNGQ